MSHAATELDHVVSSDTLPLRDCLSRGATSDHGLALPSCGPFDFSSNGLQPTRAPPSDVARPSGSAYAFATGIAYQAPSIEQGRIDVVRVDGLTRANTSGLWSHAAELGLEPERRTHIRDDQSATQLASARLHGRNDRTTARDAQVWTSEEAREYDEADTYIREWCVVLLDMLD